MFYFLLYFHIYNTYVNAVGLYIEREPKSEYGNFN